MVQEGCNIDNHLFKKINMSNICYISRSPIHYRKEIYLLMDKELDVDFFFGDSRPGKIEFFDVKQLFHFKGFLHNINMGPFYWQRGLLRLLFSKYRYFISPCDTYCINSWLFVLLAPMFGKRVLWWTHGVYGNEGPIKKTLTKLKISLLYGVLLYGEYAKKILMDYGVNEKKLHVIYNSLAYNEHSEIKKTIKEDDLYKDHFQNDNKNIIFTGRLTKVKKLNQLIEATAKLKKRNIYLNITLIGDGTEMDSLKKISQELGLQDNVWFYGACYDEKVLSSFIYNADICVSPGNVGLTAMHAMTFGTPVISHNNFPLQMPEFEAIEDGKTGTYFKENDINSLAEAIERWLNLKINRETVRQNCYEIIDKKYNPHIQIKVLKSLIK